VLKCCDPSRVVAIDSSAAFLQTAQSQLEDPRASFKQGDAQAIPEDDNTFDVAVSGLVLNFLPDKAAAAREMFRVVRPGGVVALYVWDYAGHMQIMRTFFDVAIALDPRAREFDDGVKEPMCRPGPLADLFERSGFADVEVRKIDITTAFEGFDDYWTPFLGGTGSAPKYCMSLDELAREQLRQRVTAGRRATRRCDDWCRIWTRSLQGENLAGRAAAANALKRAVHFGPPPMTDVCSRQLNGRLLAT
jgi:SAM-dependent methyltransferase